MVLTSVGGEEEWDVDRGYFELVAFTTCTTGGPAARTSSEKTKRPTVSRVSSLRRKRETNFRCSPGASRRITTTLRCGWERSRCHDRCERSTTVLHRASTVGSGCSVVSPRRSLSCGGRLTPARSMGGRHRSVRCERAAGCRGFRGAGEPSPCEVWHPSATRRIDAFLRATDEILRSRSRRRRTLRSFLSRWISVL